MITLYSLKNNLSAKVVFIKIRSSYLTKYICWQRYAIEIFFKMRSKLRKDKRRKRVRMKQHVEPLTDISGKKTLRHILSALDRFDIVCTQSKLTSSVDMRFREAVQQCFIWLIIPSRYAFEDRIDRASFELCLPFLKAHSHLICPQHRIDI